ncbi:MAG: hypothetical protein IPP74_05755 [Alphaproteobacteria bacterium]|nr:hypothetical protein [Alphaproteobacteria bacterium]
MGGMLRYFSIFTVLAIIIAAFGVGKYIRVLTEKHIILPIVEENTSYYASQYYQSIWAKYMHNIQMKSQSRRQFVEETIIYFNRLPMIKVQIISPQGKTYITTNKYDIAVYDDKIAGGEKGTNTAKILPNTSFRDKDGNLASGSLIQNKFPIIDSGKVIAYIDMYYNITMAWDYLNYFQMAVSGGLLLIGVFIYFLTFYKSYSASKIINRQQEANQELIDAKNRAELQNQEKSKFLANISHELRTPLNAVIGFSEIMRDEQFGPLGSEQYRDYIRDIHTSGVHLLSLINDILDFSKADANKLEVEMIDVDLTKAVKTAMRLVLPRAQDAKVELKENIPKQHIILKADPKRLKQVILNLLTNAVKFTPEGGEVLLVVWPDSGDGKITIEVKDTGIGIAPKDIAKAMATFGQVDNKLSRRYEGTGLGLPLSKKLVELMNGTFEIKSEVNLGTTVTIKFPAVKGSPLPLGDASEKPSDNANATHE